MTETTPETGPITFERDGIRYTVQVWWDGGRGDREAGDFSSNEEVRDATPADLAAAIRAMPSPARTLLLIDVVEDSSALGQVRNQLAEARAEVERLKVQLKSTVVAAMDTTALMSRLADGGMAEVAQLQDQLAAQLEEAKAEREKLWSKCDCLPGWKHLNPIDEHNPRCDLHPFNHSPATAEAVASVRVEGASMPWCLGCEHGGYHEHTCAKKPVTNAAAPGFAEALPHADDCGCIGCMNVRGNAAAGVEPKCWCETCQPYPNIGGMMIVCPDCGNKRCPHASNHVFACSGSNAPNQVGVELSGDAPAAVQRAMVEAYGKLAPPVSPPDSISRSGLAALLLQVSKERGSHSAGYCFEGLAELLVRPAQ